jgi:hypothetical protein
MDREIAAAPALAVNSEEAQRDPGSADAKVEQVRRRHDLRVATWAVLHRYKTF